MTYLHTLTDEELIALVRTQLDLVTSDLERVLAKRLADARDEIEDYKDFHSDPDFN